jgi:hypothetical protein
MKQFDQQYIVALERQNRLLRMIVVIGALILGATATIGWQSTAQNLTVRSLKVVDDSGRELIQLGTSKSGGVIYLDGINGKHLVALGSTEQFGDGSMNIMDTNGVRRLVAGFLKASTQSNREAGFGTYDPDGKIRIMLGQNEFNNYGLTVKGTQASQLEAGVKNDESYIGLSSVAGRLKSRWIEDGNSSIEFYDSRNNSTFTIGGPLKNISRIPDSNGGFKPTQIWPPSF